MAEPISFKFDKEQADSLELIKVTSHSPSQAETIRKGLNLLSTLCFMENKGCEIIIRSPDGKESNLTIE